MEEKNIIDIINKLKKELIELEIKSIIPYERNNRKHTSKDVNEVLKSIQRNGYIAPIVVDENNVIIVGHGRLLAIKKLKLKKVEVLRVYGMSEEQKIAYRIEDNTTGLLADFDFGNINIDLSILGDFGTDILDHFNYLGIDIGYSNDSEVNVYNEEIEDEVPEITTEIFVKPGDIFQLGNHYLMCGDSTSEKDVEFLLNGKKVNMVLTDPPYLMDYNGSIGGDGRKSGKKHKKIKNDNLRGSEGTKFLEDFLRIVKKFCLGSFYIFFKESKIKYLLDAFEGVGLQWRKQLIWNKGHLNLSNSDYKSFYESIFFGFQDDYQPCYYGWNEEHKFYGKKGEVDLINMPISSIIENPRTKFNDLHPTMKPISLLVKILNNSSLVNHKILDLFIGSGSTIIACEKNNRVCYGMELSPEYVQVSIKRYHNITGGTKEVKCLNRSNFDFSFLS